MRTLTDAEIKILENAGCTASDWRSITVAPGFIPERVRNSHFSGNVTIGSLEGSFTLPGGLVRECGIHNATLHNVSIGDGCCIINIREYIASYEIGPGCYIDDVGMMATDGVSTFGNGVRVSVLNEIGGREVAIYDRLSSHAAYMQALYRHNPDFIGRMEALTRDYVSSVASDMGSIGKGTRIIGCGTIVNVRIGAGATIHGAAELYNGSINSRTDEPVKIGQGVICKDFIISSDSKVEDGVMLTRCFVGQACRLGHGYSASDSLFFSNCQGENGEACAIFAGPFTVTHHKSTLLISGMFSFMNAGSGSNQSNHMYKLGPIHQGTLERGAKTASDSYVLWPSRVGAFSLVMGRHVTHSDTTNLPFSYLIENEGATWLVPGVNLKSVGTIRDAQKWPKRDGRAADGRLDCINFNLLSPYTVQKMMKGLDTLRNLKYASGELSDVYSFHSTKIRNSALKKGIRYYSIAIDKFMGNSLISRMQAGGGFNFRNEDELRSLLRPDSRTGEGEWADISGLIAPKSEVEALMEAVSHGKLSSLEELNAAFARMHGEYYSYEWTWVYSHLKEVYGFDPEQITLEDAILVIKRWKDAVIGLDKMVYEDARKEFDLASMTGFGADGDKRIKELDFENVRGDFESNDFVSAILRHIEKKSALGDAALAAIEACM